MEVCNIIKNASGKYGCNFFIFFYYFFNIHGSVHRESNLITVQQDATVFSLLYFCWQLYMFQVMMGVNTENM